MEEPTPGSSPKGSESLSTRFDAWKEGAIHRADQILKVSTDFLLLVYDWKWPIVIIILAGFGLIVLRESILAMLPFLSHHLKLTADFANAIVLVLDALKLVVTEIKAVINAASTLFGGKMHPSQFVPIKMVTIAEASTALIEIAKVCAPMNNGFKVMRFITRESFNGIVCPSVRVLQPTIFGHVAHVATSGLTYSPDPEWPHSCEPLVPPTHAWLCASFGSGFILLEIITPIIFIVLITYTIANVVIFGVSLPPTENEPAPYAPQKDVADTF